mmetsp:Transcript_14023/g.36221  ORF Transcript_14023/g.36221 Transcript_14023/m.36221 type:complete len:91 (-) Transcript_14023:129-401(-)
MLVAAACTVAGDLRVVRANAVAPHPLRKAARTVAERLPRALSSIRLRPCLSSGCVTRCHIADKGLDLLRERVHLVAFMLRLHLLTAAVLF